MTALSKVKGFVKKHWKLLLLLVAIAAVAAYYFIKKAKGR